LGAVLTRYTGWEGMMSVREHERSNEIASDQLSLQVFHKDASGMEYDFDPGHFHTANRSFSVGDTQYHIEIKEFILSSISLESDPEGQPAAAFLLVDSANRIPFMITQGETKQFNDLKISFGLTLSNSEGISLAEKNDSLLVLFNSPVTISGMNNETLTRMNGNVPVAMEPRKIYQTGKKMLVLMQYYKSAIYKIRNPENQQEASHDALVINVKKNQREMPVVFAREPGVGTISREILISEDTLNLIFGPKVHVLPFFISLDDFILKRYPGSQSPSSFESRVTLMDPSHGPEGIRHRIYMNNILKYKGYRFYQTSYDPDERGTVLSVNHDRLGTNVTYAGYILLALGILVSLFRKKGHLRMLSEEIKEIKKSRKNLIPLLIFLFLIPGVQARAGKTDQNIIPAEHAERFGKILIQDAQGRIEPVNTLSSEIIRKIYKKSSYQGLNADQVLIGMISNPEYWQNEPLIKVSNQGVAGLLGSKREYFPYSAFFNDRGYLLQEAVEASYRKKPALRDRFDNELIKVDERVNICYMVFTGQLLRFFPVKDDSTHTWYNHETVKGRADEKDAVFVENIIYLYVQDVQESMQTGNWKSPDDIVQAIVKYQRHTADPSLIPASAKVKFEILLNKINPFSRISNYYGIIGFLLLVIQILKLFYTRHSFKYPFIIGISCIVLLFSIHTLGLVFRWYVSGHAPWSNGYETLIYVAWTTVLAGLIFSSKSDLTLSVAPVIAFITLKIAHLSWMDPQITQLVPVLKSYWLIIHVATITASYGFLIMGALMGYISLVFMIMRHQPQTKSIVRQVTCTIEMALTVGLALLTIGIFLGAVWANESWGRYWGWDPKETWALVTMLVYAFIIHMRMIPGLKSDYAFNLASLLGVGSVIMTYFGVNYYLSGLHSYAKGDPLPIPSVVYVILLIIAITAVAAYIRKKKLYTTP
jgi:cytochrome c-type biogenesis protein CcsB